mmetsp:Transcript_50828/g.104558  ORF Transcript_50828/g.104558 Transcript_50828/m.104558 type:complete len:309 (+) Transcript_50828:806-1732(+)
MRRNEPPASRRAVEVRRGDLPQRRRDAETKRRLLLGNPAGMGQNVHRRGRRKSRGPAAAQHRSVRTGKRLCQAAHHCLQRRDGRDRPEQHGRGRCPRRGSPGRNGIPVSVGRRGPAAEPEELQRGDTCVSERRQRQHESGGTAEHDGRHGRLGAKRGPARCRFLQQRHCRRRRRQRRRRQHGRPGTGPPGPDGGVRDRTGRENLQPRDRGLAEEKRRKGARARRCHADAVPGQPGNAQETKRPGQEGIPVRGRRLERDQHVPRELGGQRFLFRARFEGLDQRGIRYDNKQRNSQTNNQRAFRSGTRMK